MYQRLARAAGSVAATFTGVQDDLSNMSSTTAGDAACESSHRQQGSSCAYARLSRWLLETGLYAWLPVSVSQATTTHDTLRWVSHLWTPPPSESAYHSLTYSVGPSSALLSDMEKALVNCAAHRLGLPLRFHWPATAFHQRSAAATGAATTAAGGHPPPSLPQPLKVASTASVPVDMSMLWPTAMRTTTGATVARPAGAAVAGSIAAPLLAQSSLASAEAVYAAPARVNTNAAGGAAGRPAASTPTPLPSPPSPRNAQSAVWSAASPVRQESGNTPHVNSLSERERRGGGSGGGVFFSSRLEAYLVLLQTARTQALTRSAGQHNAFAGAEAAERQQSRLVVYASDQADPLLLRAARLIGVSHVRVLQTVAGDRDFLCNDAATTEATANQPVKHHNYALDLARLQGRLVEDVAAGLYPMLVVGTFGSGLSGAVDPLAAMGAFCQKLGLWFHLDASHGGPALLASNAGCESPPPPPSAAAAAAADAVVKTATSFPPSRSSATPPQYPVQRRVDALAREFATAAHLSDSIVVSAGPSALPFYVLPSHAGEGQGAAVLFVAHVAKVAWAVQSLGEGRQSTFSGHVVPAASDSDVLRVSPLAHECSQLAKEALDACVLPVQPAEMRGGGGTGDSHGDGCASPQHGPPRTRGERLAALRVVRHQQFIAAVQQAVRSDGRFDAALDAAVFGVVHLRWLTAADESTAELAKAWSRVVAADGGQDLAPSHDGETGATALPAPVKVYVGLVRLQRRLWVTVSLGPLPVESAVGSEEACGGRGEQSGSACPPSLAPVLAYVLKTLDAAARHVRA